jgi:hypothetical protein
MAMGLVGDTGDKVGKHLSTLSHCSFFKFRQEFGWAVGRLVNELSFSESMIFWVSGKLLLFDVSEDFRSMLRKRSSLVLRLRIAKQH